MNNLIAPRARAYRIGLKGAAFIAVALIAGFAGSANAQYYELRTGQHQVLEADGHDSVIVTRLTPFQLPVIPDSIELTYHEPMPDSIMPASAVVIGEIRIQMEDIEDIVPYVERYARESGADWIVSFTEPKGYKTRNGDVYYRASAKLMKVLDPTFIQLDKLSYAYYEDQHVQNYADLQQYLDKQAQMGARIDNPQPAIEQQDSDR